MGVLVKLRGSLRRQTLVSAQPLMTGSPTGNVGYNKPLGLTARDGMSLPAGGLGMGDE